MAWRDAWRVSRGVLGSLVVWVVLVAVVAPMASAAQHTWPVDTRFGTGTELEASQVYPDAPVAPGDAFSIGILAWSNVNSIDAVEIGSALDLQGDCVLLSQNGTNLDGPANLFSSASATIRMGDSACSWSRTVYANDSVLGPVVEFQAVGTVVPFTVHEVGQDAGAGLVGFWVPLFVWFGVVMVLLKWHKPLAAMGATIAALGLVVPGLPTQEWALLWVLLAVWLEAIAGDRIWSAMFRKKT